jgi:asparagine synthase (glutamine-hydrolysing)
MCGIAGAVWTHPEAALPPEALARMSRELVHRGPDDEGSYRAEYRPGGVYPSTPGVALAYRRLAIIDPAGSRQPLANEDGTIQAVFNGEIYNYRELRNRLEGSGHVFRTCGDGETLVHLYEDEDVGFLDHLVGMFAIALWDARKGRLLLARDRLGQKPLVYRLDGNRLLFASELKALLAAPDVPREIDPSALDEYLTYGYVPHPNTIYRGTRKLPPAHYAVFERERLSVRRYWQPDLAVESNAPEDEQVERLRDLMTESVALRMQSDAPLGVFLSGGVDSSVIAALAQQHSDRPVQSFSIGFPVAEYDETDFARSVANHLGMQHHAFRVDPEAVQVLPELAWHFDEPFADSSAIPTYYLARMTREHVKVALSGDGADELFGGYGRYKAVKLASMIDRLPAAARKLLAGRLWQHLPGGVRQKSRIEHWRRFAEALALSPRHRYLQWMSVFPEDHRAALYTDDFLAALPESDPFEWLRCAFEPVARRDPVSQCALVDLVTYLPCDLMQKVDIATMARGLECRSPFLDHRVVELAGRLPWQMKQRVWRGKRILRRAFGHLLPRAVFRRRKYGFSVPLDWWFRNELREYAREVLLDRQTLSSGLFRAEAIRTLLDEHTAGRANHAGRLWSLLVLALWIDRWQPTVPTASP